MFSKIRYTRLKVWYNAWSDAGMNFPKINSEHLPPFIHELKTLCEHELANLAKKWSEKDKTLMSDYHKALNRHKRAIDKENEAVGALIEAKNKYAEAESAISDLEHTSPTKRLYNIIFLFLILVELPINNTIFKLFGEAHWLTLIMSLGLCVTIPFTGHLVGACFKEGIRRKPFKAAMCAISIIVISVVLISTTYLRQAYFKALQTQAILGVNMNWGEISLVFLGINLLAFLVSTWISYNAHPEDPVRYRELTQNYKKTKKTLKKAEKDLAAVQANLADSADMLANTIHMRKFSFESMKNEEHDIKKTSDNYIHYYYKVNIKHREDGEVPKCCHRDIKYEIPSSIHELKWDRNIDNNYTTDVPCKIKMIK